MSCRLQELTATYHGLVQTGLPLVVASSRGSLRAAGFTDDPGLYAIVPLLARILHIGVQQAYSLFVLGLIAASVLIGLAGVFALTRNAWSRLYAIAVALVLAFVAVRVADVYTVSFAVPYACVPWIVRWHRTEHGLPWWLLATVGVVAACSNLVRSHSATSLLLFVTLLVALKRPTSWKRALRDVVILWVGAALVTVAFSGLLALRDGYLARTVPDYQPTPVGHPFWHSTYLGLAYLKNPYVSAWDDAVAARKAAELAPGAPYLSHEYEQALRSEYFRIIRTDPLFALRTYGAKLFIALIRAMCFIGLGWVALARHRPPGGVLAPFAVAITFEMLPSLLTVPYHAYMLGLYTWSAVFGVVCVECALDDHGC